MTALWLSVEADHARGIDEACRSAVELAQRTGVGVRFVFSGVPCEAVAHDNPRRLVDQYWAKRGH